MINGVVDYALLEWCVKDLSRSQILGAEQIAGTTKYNGNPKRRMSLSNGTMVVRNGNRSSVLRASGSPIVKSTSSNTSGSISVMNSICV